MSFLKKEKYLYPKSILKQFKKLLLICYVLSLIVSVAAIGIWTTQKVYASANKQLDLLVDMVKAARTYVAEDVRPYML